MEKGSSKWLKCKIEIGWNTEEIAFTHKLLDQKVSADVTKRGQRSHLQS